MGVGLSISNLFAVFDKGIHLHHIFLYFAWRDLEIWLKKQFKKGTDVTIQLLGYYLFNFFIIYLIVRCVWIVGIIGFLL